MTPPTDPIMGMFASVAFLALGAYAVAVLDGVVAGVVRGDAAVLRSALSRPARLAALALGRPGSTTERPDLVLWVLAPAAYVGVGALALSVLPFGPGLVVADVRTGIVVFGAAEVLAIVAVHLHGWSANSPLAIVGAYRFVAASLSFMLISMFVLIAAALPAESMSFVAIVDSQSGLWNIVRQPLGLPLFVVVALGTAFWGPLNFSDGADLSGGTSIEVAGPAHLAWQAARHAMLAVYALTIVVVQFGGDMGPLLPGPVWLVGKTLAVMTLLVWLGHRVGRLPIDRFVTLSWTVLLPLSFLHLIIAGAVTLA